ncbi:MAG: uroporphyrinogen-III C-methyltransferase [Thermus sp.]|uniref:uroporphyrinogen-III C-methyltransferase n=1 Tax=Thermus sp. TaxID=275 RepID=UPI003321C920
MSLDLPPALVYLVGAGPGDPGLLTLKGRLALERAEVVLKDALVPEAFRAFNPRALWLEVGKRGYGEKTSQEEIHRLMAEHAGRGRVVVRLKGGDPMVFGRGGEEVLFLLEQGIPFVVVPGVSSATGVPSALGLPLTHRGMARGFSVLTGHDPFGLSADTLVFLMPLHQLPALKSVLLAHRPPHTPVALIGRGTWPNQAVALGRLEGLERLRAPDPALLVVGEVVGVLERLWPGTLGTQEAKDVGKD